MIHKAIRTFQVLTVAVICLILLYPLIIIFSFHLFFSNKIYPNIKVLDLDISGKSKNQALVLLKTKISKDKLKDLTLIYQDKEWTINLSSLNFAYLSQKTILKAWLLGRNSNFKENALAKWHLWQNGANLNIDYQLENQLLDKNIATIAALIESPVIPPTIEIKTFPEKEVEVKPGKQGRKINHQDLQLLIYNNLSQLKQDRIIIPLDYISSQISQAQAEKTKQRAEKLLDKKIELSFQQNLWNLNDEEIINFLDFHDQFDKEKIASYTAQLAEVLDKPPQNALFNFSGGKVIEFKPAAAGQKLNQEKTTNLLLDALKTLEAQEETVIALNLPVDLSQPEIETEDVNNLGIRELIGKGESWYRGSIASRAHNIKLASQRLNGILLPPGETFSFNDAVGEISSQTGFEQAYIIKEGRTVLDDGGGVCQVSTTIFRAALKAGLPIEERRAHAYRVAYYEQNYQVGVDATVYKPSPDLKFKNDTGHHILIQSYADPFNYKLTFSLYGSSDGRQVAISPSRIWDQTPPPPDLYQDDPTLSAGVVKQVDWKAWGAKVSFDWTVTKGSQVLQERTFYSNYRPWQAVFLKGTGP